MTNLQCTTFSRDISVATQHSRNVCSKLLGRTTLIRNVQQLIKHVYWMNVPVAAKCSSDSCHLTVTDRQLLKSPSSSFIVQQLHLQRHSTTQLTADRHTHTDRQTDRHSTTQLTADTHIQTDRHTDTVLRNWLQTHTHIQTDIQTQYYATDYRHTHTHTDRHTDRHTDTVLRNWLQIERDRQTDRQTQWHRHGLNSHFQLSLG